jgi:hypothetical protein
MAVISRGLRPSRRSSIKRAMVSCSAPSSVSRPTDMDPNRGDPNT